jgi:hypothetical protein
MKNLQFQFKIRVVPVPVPHKNGTQCPVLEKH